MSWGSPVSDTLSRQPEPTDPDRLREAPSQAQFLCFSCGADAFPRDTEARQRAWLAESPRSEWPIWAERAQGRPPLCERPRLAQAGRGLAHLEGVTQGAELLPAPPALQPGALACQSCSYLPKPKGGWHPPTHRKARAKAKACLTDSVCHYPRHHTPTGPRGQGTCPVLA